MKKRMTAVVALALAATMAMLLMAGCGSSNGKDSDEQRAAQEEPQTLGVGDTAAVGDVEYTLVGVELTDERNQFAESDPVAVAKVSYTVKNNGKEDLPVGIDCDVYGADGKKCETYPNESTMGSVAKGKAMDAVAHFALSEIGEIELQFAPAVSFDDPVVFKATVG